MFWIQNKIRGLKIFSGFLIIGTSNFSYGSGLGENDSFRYMAKVAASHFSMKNLGDIGYKEDKLSLDVGFRMNMSSKAEVDTKLQESFKESLGEFIDSLSSIRSNFIELSVGNYKGFSVHLQTIPMLTYKDFTFTNMGIGLQWSYLDFVFENMPFSSAIKIYLNKTSVSHPKDIMAYDASMLGFVHLLGKEWKYVSTYFGLGYAKTAADFTLGSSTEGTKVKTNTAGFHANASLLFTYKFLRLGAEISLIDDIKMISFKTSVVI